MNDDKEKNDIAELQLKKDIIKQTVVEILENSTVAGIFSNVLGTRKKKEFWKTLSFISTTIIAVVGFYMGWLTTIRSNNAIAERDYNQRQERHIEESIKNKIDWMRRNDDAVIDIRATRYFITLRCNYQHPFTPEEQETLRFNARYKAAKTFTGSNFVFNDAVVTKFKELVKFDESVRDVCDPTSPGDEEWWKYLQEINALMGESIQADEDKLSKLK